MCVDVTMMVYVPGYYYCIKFILTKLLNDKVLYFSVLNTYVITS